MSVSCFSSSLPSPIHQPPCPSALQIHSCSFPIYSFSSSLCHSQPYVLCIHTRASQTGRQAYRSRVWAGHIAASLSAMSPLLLQPHFHSFSYSLSSFPYYFYFSLLVFPSGINSPSGIFSNSPFFIMFHFLFSPPHLVHFFWFLLDSIFQSNEQIFLHWTNEILYFHPFLTTTQH